MAIESYKMGPGSLVFGAQAASAQITKGKVSASETVKSTDAIPVLSGDELPAQESASLTYKLDATVIQDIDAAGLVAFTWDNAGDEVAFTFIPNTVEARKVTGTVRIVPIDIGGDVDVRNTADLSWAIVGTPVLANV
jgi:hypothetical protein